MAGGGGIVPGHLVSPGTVKGMFRNPHQLHMGISHLFHILRQSRGQLPVVIVAVLVRSVWMLFPGTGMHLINRHRLLFGLPCPALLQPRAVTPLKPADIRHPGGRPRPQLCRGCKGICLVQQPVIRRLNQVFIEAALFHSRNKQLVDSQRIQTFHLAAPGIPAIELSNHMNPEGMRSPDRKIYSFSSLILGGMGPQLLENIIVGTLTEKILIHLCHKAGRAFFRLHFFHPLCLLLLSVL